MSQLDFLAQALPIEPPAWLGSGMWCCPRCAPGRKPVESLMFGPELNYRIGRCRDCGYWARFEHAFGSTSGHLWRKGTVEAFGIDGALVQEE